jgi:hypothetical protein
VCVCVKERVCVCLCVYVNGFKVVVLAKGIFERPSEERFELQK